MTCTGARLAALFAMDSQLSVPRDVRRYPAQAIPNVIYMGKPLKICLIILAALCVLSAVLYYPIQRDDTQTRLNRKRLKDIVTVGQNLKYAEQILMDAGYQLEYSDAIKPTINQDYLQQLVLVGPRQPNIFETIAYTTGLSWMPFTHSEAPYVIINANLDGKITEIR